MDVAMEFHGYWTLPSAIRIARALEPLEPMWQEDLTPLLNSDALLRLQEATRTPVCISERLLTRWQGVTAPRRGMDALLDSIEILQGIELIASDLEREILPARFGWATMITRRQSA